MNVHKQVTGSKRVLKTLADRQRVQLQPEIGRWCQGLERAVSANSSRWAKSLAKAARTKAQNIEEIAANKRSEGWRAWLGATEHERKGLCPPSKGAYRWVKGLAGWASSRVGKQSQNDAIPAEDEHGVQDDVEGYRDIHDLGEHETEQEHGDDTLTPLCDQASLEQEANGWAHLWDEGAEYENVISDAEITTLADLTISDIRLAAMSFPIDTGLGPDNIAPRALARLSDQALASLINVLHLVEKKGKWPEELDLVMIVMLPKPDGGSRPIGLFPTLIRIWMRARSTQARDWEAANDNKALYGGAGMGAQKAAWITAFNAESACLGGNHHAQALFDLVKAFEKIPHDLIITAARRKG